MRMQGYYNTFAQLLNVSGPYLSLLSEEGHVREDIELPAGELGHDIQQRFEDGQDLVVCVLKAMGTEALIAVKNIPN